MTLDELMIHYGSDKSSLCHGYTQFYELFFEPIRHNHLSLLEIGIDQGSSLRAWMQYFENASINGADINGGYEYLELEGIKPFVLDQSNEQQLIEFNSNYRSCFDIIIDDGSHDAVDQTISFNILFDGLKGGGYYVIEDLLCSYDGSRWGKNGNFYDRVRQMVGEVSYNGKMDCGQLCSNKRTQVGKYINNLNKFEAFIEWVWLSSGLCIVKKM